MWLAMFMLCGMTGYAAETAQSVLSIDPVSFSNKDKKMVAVNFENKEPIAGMQFDVSLPSFLEFDGDEAELNPERIKTHYCLMNQTTGRVLIYSMPQATIQGEDGALVYLPVKVKGNVSQSQSQSGSITVENIVYSGSKENVKLTMINGKILYENGEFIGTDVEKIYADAQEVTERLKK